MVSANVATLTKAGMNAVLLAKLKIAMAILVLPLILVTAGFRDDTRGTNQANGVQGTEMAGQPLFAVAQRQQNSVAVEPTVNRTLPAFPRAESRTIERRERNAEVIEKDADAIVRGDPRKTTTDKIILTSTGTREPKDLEAIGTRELPPGLAKKAANHPGRVAWVKAHG